MSWWQTLWTVLTYSYNAILVLFIATHLFVGAIISFLTGMYTGVYLSQNYEIPRINQPRTIWEKFMTFLENNRRNPQKVSVANVLRPSTIKELVTEPPSPSTSEMILVPKSSETATFTQAGSQTEDHGDDSENTTITGLPIQYKSGSKCTDTALSSDSSSHPFLENATTLILTEPEEFPTQSKRNSSTQIVEASLTLEKDKAISRSTNKLN